MWESSRLTIALTAVISFTIIVSSLLTPACGVSVSYQSGSGGRSATVSGVYHLDDTTSLRESASFGSGGVDQVRAVSGSGVNTLEQQASGSGYSVNNGIVSVGALSACTSVAASGDGASLSQSVAGGGNLGVSLEGTQGTSASGQEAMVLGGVMTTSQSLSAGDGAGVASGQSTAMVGAAGYVSSGALSEENRMALAGSFDGQGDMTAALSTSSLSGERAEVGGGVSVYGTQWFGDGDLEEIASENMGVTVSGLQALEDGGVGSFDLSAENANSDMLDRVGACASEGAATGGDVAVSTNYQGGSCSSYKLIGWRWNQQDPQIQLYVKDDSNLLNEGLTGQQAQGAISNAANAWDDAVAQNLFADGETVKIDATKNTDTYDHYNVHAWKKLSDAPGAIAYARTWYTTDASKKVDGYYQALESDVSYSTDYQWRTNLNDGTNKIDVQSVAMHELGHTIGLADLYNLPSDDPRKYDYEQIMNLYDGPQRYLGNGDKVGARKMYGDIQQTGSTIPGATNWKQYGSDSLYLDVDTSSAGFSQTPIYITSLGGDTRHWELEGVSAVYSPTPTGFRVYLRNGCGYLMTPEMANQRGWNVQWAGVVKTESSAGSTVPGATDWKQYGSDSLYVDLDTSSAGFSQTPIYITSLGGDTRHWELEGVSAIYSPTPTGFRVYLRNGCGYLMTPEMANQRGWNVQWTGVVKTEGSGGSTVPGATDWKQYGSDSLYLDVDTSSADPQLYFTSLGGNTRHWELGGASAIYSPTPTGFRVYLRNGCGYLMTPEMANQRGWNVQWWAN